jgi:hypothetical protein
MVDGYLRKQQPPAAIQRYQEPMAANLYLFRMNLPQR